MSNLINRPNSINYSRKINVIDSHAHFWDLEKLDYPWLDQVPNIKKNFLPEDYTDQTSKISIEQLVFVQSDCRPDQGLEEVHFVSRLALGDPRIKAIVAHSPIDHVSKALNSLDELRKNPLVRGVRCMFDDANRFLHPDSIEILRKLPNYNYTFDICINFSELSSVLKMIEQCPDTRFVIDHLGKPNIKDHAFQEFKKGMDQLASFPNVYAKISGLITEAGSGWTASSLEPYITYAIEKFGFRRLMFGSNWPVVLLNGTYRNWYQTVESFMEFYPEEDKQQLFNLTATDFYRL